MTTPADLIKKYIELRDWLERDNAASEERQKPYKAAMTTIEGALQQHLLTNDLQNMKADGIGIAFFKTATRVRLADKNALLATIKDMALQHDDPVEIADAAIEGVASYFTNALRKETVVDYQKEHGNPPAGCDITYIKEVHINRSE